ncbi:hypothetical protein [Xylella fastidiosa]|uniref:hypothetical protein n=2 Tax=Xylella fastidiosa TaxID=2371 RepID=UPI0007074CA8|nr:hypothetical protein [Xylella fastidiosa]KQH73145.1 hypothetical protein AOT81_09825 [Xylella fastidiosa]WNY22618.1 hypothetical protein RO838_11910 [Xylella fastidiosa]
MKRRQILWPRQPIEFRYALAAEDAAMQRMHASFSMLWSSRINEKHLLGALRAVLDHYPFFHGTFVEAPNGPQLTGRYSAAHPHERGGVRPVVFEMESYPQALANAAVTTLYDARFLATLIPEKPDLVASRRALLHFRLCQFADASIFSVVWNHALSDLHGIYAFLHAVSRCYSGATDVETPLFDRGHIWNTLPESRWKTGTPPGREGRHGIVSISRTKAALGLSRYFLSNAFDSAPVCLFLDGAILRSMQYEAANRGATLSRNDLINAALLKLHVAAPKEQRDPTEIQLYFPINLRPLLGLRPVVIGNCLGNVSMSVPLDSIVENDLFDIACIVRDARQRLDLNIVSTDRDWFEYWKPRCSRGEVYHHWLLGRHRVYSSNWMDDHLADFSFGDAQFRALLRNPRIARGFWFPNFHCTILPRVTDHGIAPVVRLSVSRRQLATLDTQKNQVPFIGVVIK